MTSNANNTQVIQIIQKLCIIRKSERMFWHRMFRHKIAETDVSAYSDRIQRLPKRMFRHFHDCRNGCFDTMCRNCFWPKHPAPLGNGLAGTLICIRYNAGLFVLSSN